MSKKPRAGTTTATGALVREAAGRADAGVDILLTAPILVAYHFGVVFLTVRNGLDPVTDLLLAVLHRSLLAYLGITLAVGVAFWLVARIGRIRGKLRGTTFVFRIAEATAYAIGMWGAAQLVVAHTLGPSAGPRATPLAALVLSMGAGFYEEVVFRVGLFGAGVAIIHRVRKGWEALGLDLAWGLVAAAAFSAAHYIGPLGDRFELASFVFRLTCGAVLTVIYRLRGFAAAVWTHALYDVGVMVF